MNHITLSAVFSALSLASALCGCATSVPAWNERSREETLAWFLENEYGVRPAQAESPDVSFAAIGPDVVAMDGKAVRKLVAITYRGPYGTNTFPVTAFIPTKGRGPHPAFLLICNRDPSENIDSTRKVKSEFWPAEALVERGFAAVAFFNGDIAPDCAIGNTEGVFACYEDVAAWRRGLRHRKHNAWGTLSAWAWGASRVMDWIETVPSIDSGRVAVVGHSRGGKTALLTGVLDSRFAMACVNDSGCSGTKLNRMPLPDSESIAAITRSFPYWFCNNYRMWVNRDAEMPFDQHQFMALMAPRLLAVGSATDDAWAGPAGEEESCRLARPAWKNPSMVDYHIRPGKHDLTLVDWNAYMDFAERHGWLLPRASSGR